ncbi:MAG: TonB-dependent receptor [Acidiferrobacterales bacterium]|nr:TonB-dependent receptor [Acidiferrobacterales bacterium]
MKLNPIALVVLSPMLGVSVTGYTQESAEDKSQAQADSPMVELIEVTSQRRVQNIQDVPISVQAFNGEQLDRVSIDKIEDLQLYVPNLNLTETGLSTQMFVRGIGSGNNQGFEQSVVQFIDGVSYARQQLSRAPFFDMERVEVLRGPQSILFGKNAIGGALNFTTAPVREYTEGKLFAQFGEFGIREYQAIVNGEIYDERLYGRLSVRHYEEDGYVENVILDRDEPQREDQTLRAKLLYIVNDNWKLNAKYEKSDFETIGRSIEILQDIGDPGNPFGTTLSAGFGVTDAIPETELNYVRAGNGDTSYNNIENATVEVTGLIGNVEFESRTAILKYDFQDDCDCDFIGANVFTVPLEEDYEQFSQEFRIASDLSGKFSWQAGVFYQTSDLIFADEIALPQAEIGETNLGVLPTAVFALTGSEAQGASLSGVSAARDFTQTSDALAIFGQLTYQLTTATQINIGARWSTEDKDGFRSINIIDADTGLPASNPLSAVVLEGLFAIESEQTTGHSLSGSRSEIALDPSINVQHYLDEDVMIYASWSKGSKAGGFDARANTVSSFEFDGEEATAYELGVKSTFWNNRAKLNLTFYATDYESLQVSQFDGTLGFVVGNADAEMQGVEVDGTFALTNDFSLSYSLAYLDHEYTSYEDGNCYYRQQFDMDHPDLAARYNEESGLCDYSGLTGQFAPKLSGNLNADYYIDVSDNAVLHLNLNYNYTSAQNTHQNLDPVFEQDAVARVDANIALEFDQWGVELLGKNITDEEFVTYSGNSPLSGTFGADTVYGFVAPPATWSLRGYYNF